MATLGRRRWYYTHPQETLKGQRTISSPTVISRAAHTISRADISKNAVKVLYQLKKAGYEGYLVGGGVRDLLLGREPKDFDVATDASPEQVKKLFRNCRLIGRRFRLAHIHFGREIIEVATFRAHHDVEGNGEGATEDGRIVRDNVYGTLDEDAVRRDFTVNALYYNIRDFSVVDFCNGVEDLDTGILRFIGDTDTRIKEDPVRMLRAVRFAAKLGFRIHKEIEEAIPRHASLLGEVPAARLYDEILKLFHGGCALQSFELLRHYGLFAYLFPATEECLAEELEGYPRMLIARALENTDQRINEGRPVTPAFLFAALLWEPLRRLAEGFMAEGMREIQALQEAADEIVPAQSRRIMIPRRFSQVSREIWTLQPRLDSGRTRRKIALRLLEHPRFRAGYDFLLLRAECGEADDELANWWTEFQEVGEEQRGAMLQPEKGKPRRRRRRRRKAAE